jgi:uncharacterized membrane protein
MKSPVSIDYNPKSLLAFLTVFSFAALLGGTFFKAVNEPVGAQIASIALPVFVVCFVIWIVYIFLSISSRFR